MKPCIIVASGQSAKGFIPPDDVTVIAVNGAIDWLSRADHWFTLDLSPQNRYRIDHPKPRTEYHVALPEDKTGLSPLRYRHLPAYVKLWERVSNKSQDKPNGYSVEYWLWRWGAVTGINKDGKIHTGNSAWGALQLAYHLGYRKALLVGVDADRNPRIEGGKPNMLNHLPLLFESAMNDMELVSCGNMKSKLPHMNIKDGVSWLRGSV